VDTPQCVDCGANVPEHQPGDTLISVTLGWRLTRTVLADGTRQAEWRCPACWRKYKTKAVPTGGSPGR